MHLFSEFTINKRLDDIDTRLRSVETDVAWIKGKFEGKQEGRASVSQVITTATAVGAAIIALILLLCMTGCEKSVDMLTPVLSEDSDHVSDDMHTNDPESKIVASYDIECFDDPKDIPEWWYNVTSLMPPEGVPHNFVLCDSHPEEDQEEIIDEEME